MPIKQQNETMPINQQKSNHANQSTKIKQCQSINKNQTMPINQQKLNCANQSTKIKQCQSINKN